jgi:hypothetical protein
MRMGSRFNPVCFASEHLRCSLDGVDDRLVACATAEVPFNGFSDLLIRGVGCFVEEGLSGHEEARRAETAL